jgi:hypothetical protein
VPDAVWQELVTLVPRERLIARLRGPGKPNASIQIEDLGAMFRISVLNKVREYREEARECAYRAKVAALFAALISAGQRRSLRATALFTAAGTSAAGQD